MLLDKSCIGTEMVPLLITDIKEREGSVREGVQSGINISAS